MNISAETPILSLKKTLNEILTMLYNEKQWLCLNKIWDLTEQDILNLEKKKLELISDNKNYESLGQDMRIIVH